MTRIIEISVAYYIFFVINLQIGIMDIPKYDTVLELTA